MANTELSVLFTSKGDLQNDLSSLRKELQGVQRDIKAATDAGDTGKVDALSRDYASLEGRIAATRHELKKVNGEIKNTANEGVKSTSKLEGAWKKLQKVTGNPLFTAVSVAAITMFAKSAIQSFAEVEDATAALQSSFGDSGDRIVAWANDTAIAFNLSKREALTAAQTMAVFGDAAGLTGQELESFAIGLTERAADAASYFGGSTADAITAFGAALRGENEPIRKYGVLLDDATLRLKAMEMGLISTTSQALTPQQKTLAAYNAVMEQTTRVQGDVARTQDSMANRIKQSQAQFENLKSNVGETIAIGLAPLVGILGQAMDLFNSMPAPLRSVVVIIGALGAALLILLPRILSVRQAFIDSGIQASMFAGKLSMLGTAASRALGPIGLLITALTFYWSAQNDAQQAAESLADTLDEVTGAATEATRAMMAEEFLRNFSSEDLAQTPFTLNEIVDAALEGGPAFEHLLARVNAWTDAQKQGLNGLNPLYNNWLNALENSVEAQGRDADNMRLVNRERREASKVTEEVTKATEDLAMSAGRATNLVRDLGRQMPLASYKASEYYQAISEAKDATDGLVQSLSDLSAAVSTWGAKQNFKKSVKDYLATPSQEAAVAMVSAFQNVADSITDPVEKAAFMEAGIKKIDAAIASGGVKLPKEVRDSWNETKASVDRTNTAIARTQSLIDALPDSKTIRLSLQTYGRVPAWATDAGAGPTTATDATGDWNGGYVRGPGTATSDSIRMRLSNGEFVMRAAAVKAIGVKNLYRMNSEKAVDPALLERAEAQGHGGPLIGQVVVNNPGENVDVEAAIATALRRAERRRKERA